MVTLGFVLFHNFVMGLCNSGGPRGSPAADAATPIPLSSRHQEVDSGGSPLNFHAASFSNSDIVCLDLVLAEALASWPITVVKLLQEYAFLSPLGLVLSEIFPGWACRLVNLTDDYVGPFLMGCLEGKRTADEKEKEMEGNVVHVRAVAQVGEELLESEDGFPRGVAIGRDAVYVLKGSDNDCVEKYTRMDGTFLASWGSVDENKDELDLPVGIAINPITDNVLIADTSFRSVLEFTPEGRLVRQWEVQKNDNDKHSPLIACLAVDAEQKILHVGDCELNRITTFSLGAEMTCLSQTPQKPPPIRLTVDPVTHHVWVLTDTGVRVLNSDGARGGNEIDTSWSRRLHAAPLAIDGVHRTLYQPQPKDGYLAIEAKPFLAGSIAVWSLDGRHLYDLDIPCVSSLITLDTDLSCLYVLDPTGQKIQRWSLPSRSS